MRFDRRTALLAWVAFAAGVAAGAIVRTEPDCGPHADGQPHAFGWVDDTEEVRAAIAGLPQPVFSDTPAGQNRDPLPPSAYLWDYHRRIAGENPKPHDQGSVGSCVAFGSSRAYERSLAAQIARGEPFEFRHLVEEAIYGISRVQIGGGRIRGDGSIGAWAAKGFADYGGLPRGEHLGGKYRLKAYSESLCRNWGRYGLPADLVPVARQFPAGAATQVRTWAEAKRAIAQGYGIFVCSNQGFSRQRDRNGVAAPQGTWMHCMALDGYHVEGGREYGHIENSWGAGYHVGPVGWGSPSAAGFWADASVIHRMLGQGDSFAVSAVRGFPARRVDWDIGAGPRGLPADRLLAMVR